MAAVAQFQQTAPGVHISVTTADIGGMIKLLENREIDVCLVLQPTAPPATEGDRYVRRGAGLGRCRPCAGGGASLAQVQDCLNCPIVIDDEFMVMGRAVRDMARAQAPPHAAKSSNSTEYMKAFSRRGGAVTFFSRLDVDDERRDPTLAWRFF